MLPKFFKWQFLQEYNYLRTEKSGEGIIKNGGKAEKERKCIFSLLGNQIVM